MNKTIISVAALSCLAATMQAQKKAAAQRPNIVYIMCDDHAFQCISAYGHAIGKLAPTPNIDRIAERGMRFDKAFVENSLSTPSRACLMTGLYSHQNGQRQLGEGIDTSRTFFTELLQDAGYQTAIIGKWHMGCDPKGFDYYHIYNDQGQYWNPQYRGTDTPEGKYIVEEGYSTDLSTDHAIDFMDHRDKSKPFCLMLHHKAPHRNWQANIKYLGKYDNVNFPMPETFYDDYATRGEAVRTQKMSVTKHMRWEQDFKVPEMLDLNNEDSKDSYNALMGEINRMTPAQRSAWGRYYFPRNRKLLEANLKGKELDNWKYQAYIRDYMSVIASVDESVGRVLDYLDQNGLTDNTIIVYTSDQGFYMGEHGWFDKRFMYEESLRTPLIISYPGHTKPGSVCHKLVQNIDYAPTFLELAGVKKPQEWWDVRSFLSSKTATLRSNGEPVSTTTTTTILPTTWCASTTEYVPTATSSSTSMARADSTLCLKTSTRALRVQRRTLHSSRSSASATSNRRTTLSTTTSCTTCRATPTS